MVRRSSRLARVPRVNYAPMLNKMGRKKPSIKTRKGVTKLVKKVIDSKAETKMVCFFNGSTQATAPLANSTGLYTDASPVSHNPVITSNPTDILKIIPDIDQGVGDNQRSGKSVTPVGATLRCKVMLSPTSTGGSGWQAPSANAYDLTFVAYLLSSVTFKTYRTLYVDNDFGKMLSIGDGTTTFFDGSFSSANLPVEKGYYRVHKVVRKNLRSSGVFNSTGGAVLNPTNNNSHPLCHEWTWNYKKYLPKKLTYPEDTVTAANGGNEPLNSSLFWAIGYYQTDGSDANLSGINVQIEYTSILRYKDM